MEEHTKKRKERSIGLKLLTALLFLVVLIYFGVQGWKYLDDPLMTTLAYPYQVEMTMELSGWVVRSEELLPDEGGGLLRIQRSEGERVSRGGVVAAVYADQASLDRQAEIDSLTSRLEQLRYAQDLAQEAETTQKLDGQIEQSLLSYRRYLTAGRFYDADEEGSRLRALVTKRDYTGSGDGDLSARIQEAENQIAALRGQSSGSVRRITAPKAGLYSGEVDGYETVLTPDMLENLTPSALTGLTADASAVSQAGKLILGDTWYYAAVVSAEEAAVLEEQSSLQLRFSKGVDRDLPVRLESVGPREQGRVVAVFRGDSYLRELTLLRQQRAQVVYGSSQGLRVPKEALRALRTESDRDTGERTSEDATGIYCVVGLKARFKPVEILYTGDHYVLVRAASEDTSLRLRSGDEIIVSARDLFDGKIIG